MSGKGQRMVTSANGTRPLRIYCCGPKLASFIRSDLELLSRHGTVHWYAFDTRYGAAWSFLRAGLSAMRHVPCSDVVVCQFAGWSAWWPLFLGRVFRRRSVLVVHGTDCVSFPSIGYGNFRKWPLRWITRQCLRWATQIRPVHESLVASSSAYSTGQPLAQGIRTHCPGLRTPIVVMHHGFDPDRWPLGRGPRTGLLTVASGLAAERTRMLKGIDLIISAATLRPKLHFTVVGLRPTDVAGLPPNVRAIPFMPQAALVGTYQQAAYYLQLSISEGFGCALSEAMLCGCVPIVSESGSLPDIMGGAGWSIAHRSVEDLVRCLDALPSDPGPAAAEAARRSIVRRFPLEARAKGWNGALRS